MHINALTGNPVQNRPESKKGLKVFRRRIEIPLHPEEAICSRQ